MVGRNEPCPCGSGKKYKHCCLRADEARARTARGSHESKELSAEAAEAQVLQQTGFSTAAELQEAMEHYRRFCESIPDGDDIPSFMEYLHRPSPASDLVRQIRGEVGDRSFESEEELNQFLQHRMSSMNNQPKDDFEGLSSARMHEILHARDAEQVPLLRFHGSLTASDANAAPVVATIRWVLQYHADHGGTIRLTARQNYPRALCRAYLAHFAPWYREGMSVPNEESLSLLVLAHDLVVGFDWTDETKAKSELTTEGVQVLGSGGATTIFQQSLQYLLISANWTDSLGYEYEDAVDHLELVQNAAIFSLYLLSHHPEGTIRDLFDRFTRAFPEFVKPAQGDHRTIDWLGSFFADLFIDEFCVPLGLVALTDADRGRAVTDSSHALARRYRTAKLFKNALGWG